MVYKGKDKDDKMVAIKQLVPKLPNQEKYHQGELDVIDLKLKHDNIVIVYGYFTPQDSSVKNITIVMELCEAGDLSQYYLSNNPDVATRYNFMLDMAKGVGYLHNHGIVHRDLKPENVLLKPLDTRLVCKISDFGISKIQQRRDDVFATQIGSFAYMAPEMMDHQEYSKPVDVFALGLLFFVTFKRSILANYFGEEALIPGYLDQQRRIHYFNSDINKEKLDEASLLATHFNGSEAVGELFLLMTKSDPEKRCEMEHVLVKIADAKVRNELEECLQNMKEGYERHANKIEENMTKKQRNLENQRDELKREIQNITEASNKYRNEMAGRVAQQQDYIKDLEEKMFETNIKLQDIFQRHKTKMSDLRMKEGKDVLELIESLLLEKSYQSEELSKNHKSIVTKMQKILHEKETIIYELNSNIEDVKRQAKSDSLVLEHIFKQLQKHQSDKELRFLSHSTEHMQGPKYTPKEVKDRRVKYSDVTQSAENKEIAAGRPPVSYCETREGMDIDHKGQTI